MNDFGMSQKEQKFVKGKYLAIQYDFLIGFKSESVTGDYDALYSGDMSWPVPSCHSVSSPYGMRTHPTLGTKRMHYGIDIPAQKGAIVKSPADGKIMSYEHSSAIGWTMVVDHGENKQGERIVTRYAHLSAKVARVGQIVKAGDSIAEVGNTGKLTTGAHLHFEVYVNGVTVDPAKFFRTR